MPWDFHRRPITAAELDTSGLGQPISQRSLKVPSEPDNSNVEKRVNKIRKQLEDLRDHHGEEIKRCLRGLRHHVSQYPQIGLRDHPDEVVSLHWRVHPQVVQSEAKEAMEKAHKMHRRILHHRRLQDAHEDMSEKLFHLYNQ